MKKLQSSILILLLCLISSLYCVGQYSEGKKYLEGSFNIGKANLEAFDQKKDLSSNLNLTYGKFVTKSKARFWTFGFTQSSTENHFEYLEKKSNYRFSLGLGNEYYKQIFGNLGIYGRLQGNLYAGNSSHSIKDDYISSNNRDESTFSSGVTLGGSGGISYFISKKLALVVPIVSTNVFEFNFSQTKMPSFRTNYFYYSISPTISLNMGIGIRYVL